MTKYIRHENLALLVALAILSATSCVGFIIWLDFLQGDKSSFFVALLPLACLFYWAWEDRHHGFPIIQAVLFGFYALGWMAASIGFLIKNAAL